ncbi:MAG: replication factor C large subunit [Candidatus Woesearchaeota archaeon]|nr:MAG: replication factor C large subunit [Candidatus Woesearchaeota archaeon]
MQIPIWSEKYKPKTLSDVCGQADKDKILTYIETFQKGKKPLFLWGPVGTGKTSAVHATARELGLEIIEVNASDARSAKDLKETIGPALYQRSLFSKGKIILIDEIDSASGVKDRGGVDAVAKLAQETTFPFIITGHDPYTKKVKSLKKVCQLISFDKVATEEICERLKYICIKEQLSFDEEGIKLLAQNANGDLRAAINDLQLVSSQPITKENIAEIETHNQTEKMKSALFRVFKTKQASVAREAIDNVGENIDEVFAWVDENIAKEYTKPEDLARAYNVITKADVFKQRIMRWQYYRFYVYCYALLSAGIALAKEEKYKTTSDIKEPTRGLQIWFAQRKLGKKKTILQALSPVMHTSTRKLAGFEFPYLLTILKTKPALLEELHLDEETKDWVREKSLS